MVFLVFGVSAALVVYTLFVYPCVVWGLSRFGRPVDQDPQHTPTISLLVPVYNEEDVIQEKLENCLALDYPEDRLEIVFASDGSTDRSVQLLQSCSDPRVVVLDYPTNRGKAEVLNQTIPQLKGQVVVLSDASGILDRSALKLIGSLLHDRQVGCVCAIYHIFKEGRTRVDCAESSYQGFEMQLRLWEARFWSSLSGTGALLAIRRADYQPLPPRVINEDFLIPSRIALQGKRVVYDTRLHVFDRIFTSLHDVYRRRVRIAYGNWQQLSYLRPLLNPLRGYLSWVFYSHKLLRMAVPYLLVLMLVTSYALSPWMGAILTAGLCGLLGLGAVGLVLDRYLAGHNPLAFISLIFFNCVAVLVGTLKFVTGSGVKW